MTTKKKKSFTKATLKKRKKFPSEMNVAATLALTVKPAKVKVRVVSDPAVNT